MQQLAASEVLALSTVLKAHHNMIHLCNHFANETNDAQLKQLCETLIHEHDAEFHRLSQHLGGTAAH